MPKQKYTIMGNEKPKGNVWVTIPKEIRLRQGIRVGDQVEVRDCQEIDEQGKVRNVIKVYKVEQDEEPVKPFDPCGKECPDEDSEICNIDTCPKCVKVIHEEGYCRIMEGGEEI